MKNDFKLNKALKNFLLFILFIVPIISFFVPRDIYYGNKLRLFSNLASFIWIVLDIILYIFFLKQAEMSQKKENIFIMILLTILAICILLLPYKYNFTLGFDDRIRTWGAPYWLLLFFISKRNGYTNKKFDIIAYVFLLPMVLWNLFASLIF